MTGPERADPERADPETVAADHPGASAKAGAGAGGNAGARAPRPWRVALSLFTVIPAGVTTEIRRGTAARAVPWLPAVGALTGVIAAGVMVAVQAGGQSGARRLLAATLAVAVLGLLTGGLHLDGLADTADGLGSRRPRREALAIMRRSDIGPMGVAALLLVVLVQITALAALPTGGLSVAAVVLAAVTGRVAVVLATGPGSPSARPGGFGALITDTTTTRARATVVAALLAAVAAGAFLLGTFPQAAVPLGRAPSAAALGSGLSGGGAAVAARWLVATLAGLLAADQLRRTARRRLGGMTGDVFGAVIEVGTATVLLVLALSS